jgi:spermidine/putrescine transport system substrate-binding protein
MPANQSLIEAGARIGHQVLVESVASNERLEKMLGERGEYDLIFPSDYLVERLATRGDLALLEHTTLPLEHLAAWSREADHDPGCRWSVPFAYGTTGYLTSWPKVSSWEALLDPPAGARVGMLEEVREVVGAALIATGHAPNDVGKPALTAAGSVLRRQRPNVISYQSEDFISPVLTGAARAHHAWSGPAARAAREHPHLRYVVPEEGAVLWTTAAAIPSAARDIAASMALLGELMDPVLAVRTTVLGGFATPNEAARRRLPRALRDDSTLFPGLETLARCHTLRDLGECESRLASASPFAP